MTTETAKPRIRPLADNRFLVSFQDGRSATLHQDGRDWRGTVLDAGGEIVDRVQACGLDHAVRAAASVGLDAPVPVADVDALTLATKAEADFNNCISLLRNLLRKRTGRAWSVKRGRGTAYGWITVDAPPRRKVNGYMTAADQATLASIFGRCHLQGLSIRTERGVRAAYVCRAAGVDLPESITVAPPSWD